MNLHSLFFVTQVPKNLTAPVKIIECGCCGHYHRLAYFGDCRNDNERFLDPEDAQARLDLEVVEVYE